MPDPLFEIFLTSCGLNGLHQKGCHILVKNWIFDDPFHKLVILVPVMIRPSGSGSLLGKFGFRGYLGQWGCRGNEFNETGEVSKTWKITTEDFHVLEFNNLRSNVTLFWGLKKAIFWQNHENSHWILTPFLSEAVEAAWGQKRFKQCIRHKSPLLREPLSNSFW